MSRHQGVEDKNRTVVGVQANSILRNQLQADINDRLSGIEPRIASSTYRVKIHPVKENGGTVIDDLVVIEVLVGYGEKGYFYCSKGGSFYIREGSRKFPLKGQSLVAEIKRRVRLGLL